MYTLSYVSYVSYTTTTTGCAHQHQRAFSRMLQSTFLVCFTMTMSTSGLTRKGTCPTEKPPPCPPKQKNETCLRADVPSLTHSLTR